jgi:hypothetical protein
MPCQPYDTGWIKSIFGGIFLAWYLCTVGLLPHLISVLCYNHTCIPFIALINKWYELIGNIIVFTGKAIIKCEATIFEHFNYIDPIYNIIERVESIFTYLDINIGPPNIHHIPSNIQRRKTSTGRHLSSYYAQKRRNRRRQVISGSNQSKSDNSNDDDNDNTNTKSPPYSHYVELYSNNFHPIDNPSYQDNTWYDPISPYWTGGMVWKAAYVLNHQVVSVTTDPIFVFNLSPA